MPIPHIVCLGNPKISARDRQKQLPLTCATGNASRREHVLQPQGEV